jgi:hypothetical protein
MSFKDFLRKFQGIYCCQLFQNNTTFGNYYFDKGNFKDRYAGGPMVSIRDRDEGLKMALKIEHDSLLKVGFILHNLISLLTISLIGYRVSYIGW